MCFIGHVLIKNLVHLIIITFLEITHIHNIFKANSSNELNELNQMFESAFHTQQEDINGDNYRQLFNLALHIYIRALGE